MGEPVNFYGPYLKTERAERHINELEAIFWRAIRANKKALRPQRNQNVRKRGVSIGGLPKHTPTILGDALHNLRAALDHAYCILVEANGHTVHERSFFPITNKGRWEDRKGSVEGHEKAGCGPGEHMISVIFDEIQPYPGGKGQPLVDLHLLDIADKHTVLLPTEQTMLAEDIRIEGGGGIFGLTLTRNSDGPLISLGSGVALEQKHNQKASFEICFGKGQPFEGQPILPVVKGLANRVQDTLRLLERRASEAP